MLGRNDTDYECLTVIFDKNLLILKVNTSYHHQTHFTIILKFSKYGFLNNKGLI